MTEKARKDSPHISSTKESAAGSVSEMIQNICEQQMLPLKA